MIRTIEDREERQRALRETNHLRERWDEDPEFFTLLECAMILKVSRSTARRIFRFEKGVRIMLTPGSRRPIVRVPRAVLERVMRRSANLGKG